MFRRKRRGAPSEGKGQLGALPNGSTGDGSGSRAIGTPNSVGLGIGVAQPGRRFERFVSGKEPPNAEVRDFMEKTRALREWLVSEAEARNMERAEDALKATLSRLWTTPGSARDRQEKTFALWDECAEDERGAKGRAHIEAFVQQLQERRGACPFEAEVVARLNAKRKSKRPFTPCAGPQNSE